MAVNKVLIYNILSAGTTMMLTLVLLAKLTADQYGSYALIHSVYAFALAIGGLKTGELLLQTQIDRIEQSNIVAKLLWLDCFIHVILFLIVTPLSVWYAQEVEVNRMLMVSYQLLILINIGYSITESLYVVRNRLDIFYLIKMLHGILSLFVCGYFATRQNLAAVLLSYVALTLIRNFFGFIFLYQLTPRAASSFKKRNFDISQTISFFKYNFVSSSLKSGTEGLDVIILSFLIGKEQSGIYQAAKKLASIPSIYFASFWASRSHFFYEKISRKSFEKVRLSLLQEYRFYIICFFAGLFFSFNVESLFFEYFPAFNQPNMIEVFFILFSGYYLMGLFSGHGRFLLIALDKIKYLTFLNLLVFITVVVGYPIIGYLGGGLTDFAVTLSTIFLFNSALLNYEIFKNEN